MKICEYGAFDAVVRSPFGVGKLLHEWAGLESDGQEHQAGVQTGRMSYTRDTLNCHYDRSLKGKKEPHCQ